MADKFKFDVVIGNPPYQDETIGDSTQAPPVYHEFMEEAYKIADRVSFITPGRFLYNAGATPKSWNKKMLLDSHLKVVFYEQNSAKVFPNTDIKGGVAITYRDSNKVFGSIEVFSSYTELNNFFHKVTSQNTTSLSTIMYGQNTYKFTKKVHDENPDVLSRLSKGHENDLTTSVFEKLPDIFMSEEPDNNDYIKIYGRQNNERVYRWVKKKYIIAHENLEKYKVFIPKSNGSGAIGEVLSTPLIGDPLIGHTQTFISAGAFDTKKEAENLLKYIKTKFARTILGILKITQDNPPEKWKFVPLQDFTDQSDVPWHLTIPEIDQYLYQKYGLSQEEIDFIEEKVKAME